MTGWFVITDDDEVWEHFDDCWMRIRDGRHGNAVWVVGDPPDGVTVLSDERRSVQLSFCDEEEARFSDVDRRKLTEL